MRRAIAALAAFLALSGHTGSAFLAPPKGRPGGKSRAKKASPRKVAARWPAASRKAGAKPGAAPKQFHLPSLPSLPSPQDLRDLPGELRERAEESWDARPRSPEEARVAALEALARVSEEIRVGQVLFGFTLSFALFSGALVTTSRILGEYLSSEGRGEVSSSPSLSLSLSLSLTLSLSPTLTAALAPSTLTPPPTLTRSCSARCCTVTSSTR